MNRLSFIGRLLPYFLVRKLAIDRFTRDMDAVLEYDSLKLGKWERTRLPVNVYQMDDGEWVVRSVKNELENKKRRLQNEINEIDNRLDAYIED